MPRREWEGQCRRDGQCGKLNGHEGECGPQEYFVPEEVWGQRVHHTSHQFLVKWEGWPVGDAAWEPRSALPDEVMQDWDDHIRDMPRFGEKSVLWVRPEMVSSAIRYAKALGVPKRTADLAIAYVRRRAKAHWRRARPLCKVALLVRRMAEEE